MVPVAGVIANNKKLQGCAACERARTQFTCPRAPPLETSSQPGRAPAMPPWVGPQANSPIGTASLPGRRARATPLPGREDARRPVTAFAAAWQAPPPGAAWQAPPTGRRPPTCACRRDCARSPRCPSCPWPGSRAGRRSTTGCSCRGGRSAWLARLVGARVAIERRLCVQQDRGIQLHGVPAGHGVARAAPLRPRAAGRLRNEANLARQDANLAPSRGRTPTSLVVVNGQLATAAGQGGQRPHLQADELVSSTLVVAELARAGSGHRVHFKRGHPLGDGQGAPCLLPLRLGTGGCLPVAVTRTTLSGRVLSPVRHELYQVHENKRVFDPFLRHSLRLVRQPSNRYGPARRCERVALARGTSAARTSASGRWAALPESRDSASRNIPMLHGRGLVLLKDREKRRQRLAAVGTGACLAPWPTLGHSVGNGDGAADECALTGRNGAFE